MSSEEATTTAAQEQTDGGTEASGATAQAREEEFVPFTDADVERALAEEKNTSSDDGWKMMNRSEFAEVWRKSDADKPVHLIRGSLYFPGIPTQKVIELIHDLEVRKRWDTQFPEIDVIEKHPTYRVVYWRVKMPPAVADRDVVQYIGQRFDEPTNTTYLLYRNAIHPKVPEKRGLVRAETIFSAVIIRPDAQDVNSTRMSIFLQNDVKGWVPHFLVNAFAARAPGQWRDALYNYYVNVHSKQAASQEEEKGGGQQGEAMEQQEGVGQQEDVMKQEEGTEQQEGEQEVMEQEEGVGQQQEVAKQEEGEGRQEEGTEQEEGEQEAGTEQEEEGTGQEGES